jgi:hypothetical protein
VTLHPHHIRIASDNSQFHTRGRAATHFAGIKGRQGDCVCRDTSTIVPIAAHSPTFARSQSIRCRRRRVAAICSVLSGNIAAFRQDRAAQGKEIFRPKETVIGPAVDAVVALILKFSAASGRKSCVEKPKTPILGSRSPPLGPLEFTLRTRLL